MKRAKVISFINYKGGVAKTTSTYHIACWLAGIKQKKVLLIDIDPQTNLTFLCASVEDWKKQKSNIGTIATMYKRFLEKKPVDTKRYIWKEPILVREGQRHPRVDLIPCDIDLIGEDIGSGQIAGSYPSMKMLQKNAGQFIQDRHFLREVIREVEEKYDYILIDCPPNLYLMTQNALTASDYYVITAIPDHLSTIGLSILIDKAKKIKKFMNTASDLAGHQKTDKLFASFGAVLFVRVRIGGAMLTNAHADKMDEVRSSLGADKCFNTHTTELIGYTEAAENSLPVWLHDTDNARRAAQKQEYPRITEELLEKF